MTDAREKLRQLARNPPPVTASGPLYQWLCQHYDEIMELRESATSWDRIVQIASEDGIPVSCNRRGLQEAERKWRAVCHAKARSEARRSRRKAERETRKEELAAQPVMPSRLPADWKPEFVEQVASDSWSDARPSDTPLRALIDHSPGPSENSDADEAAILARGREKIAAIKKEHLRQLNARHGYHPKD